MLVKINRNGIETFLYAADDKCYLMWMLEDINSSNNTLAKMANRWMTGIYSNGGLDIKSIVWC